MHERSNVGKEQREKDTFGVFKERIRGWERSPDGDDYCPACWKQFLGELKENERQWLREDSTPSWNYPETLRASDAWYIECWRCRASVAVPYSEKLHG